MDYDPFEIHMQLLALMRRLSASHQSIDNVVAFLVRYRDKCADDLWECVTDECQKVREQSRPLSSWSSTRTTRDYLQARADPSRPGLALLPGLA